METQIWVNTGSGNDLLPDGTKPLPEPVLAYQQWGPVTIIRGKSSQATYHLSITKISLKITYLKVCSALPGINELTYGDPDEWHHMVSIQQNE